jgi:hypothetical protein
LKKLQILIIVVAVLFLATIGITAYYLQTPPFQSQLQTQIGIWTIEAEALGLGGLIIVDVSRFFMERMAEETKERLNKIHTYQKQLNDRILSRWLATQVEPFIPQKGDSLPASRFVELRWYILPFLPEFVELLPLKSRHDSSYVGESAQDWYQNDALLHLLEFAAASMAALKAKDLAQKRNQNAQRFVEFEDGIARKLA